MARYISDPQGIITELFEQNGRKADSEFREKVATHFEQLVQEGNVPHLQALHRDAPVGTLVRFRAIVQDTVSDDIYASTSADGTRCTVWSETAIENIGDMTDYSRLAQRQLLYCTEVPAETPWAKRELYSSMDAEVAFSSLSFNTGTSTGQAHATALEKRFVPNGPHIGALVKLCAQDDAPRPTDIIDVYGIYEQTSWSPCASYDPAENEVLPSVACIYTIFWRPAELMPISKAPVQPSWRDALIARLTSVLDGDSDAAEWLLLHLVSSIHTRRASLALGTFPLNLALAHDRITELEETIASLVPAMRTLHVDLKTLNDPVYPFYSPRSVDENLETGALQLAPLTQVFVDETQMKEGHLNEKGVRNVRTLSTLITDQTIEYVFPFSQFSFQTDLPVLVLSKGKSFLQMPIVVNVTPSSDSSNSTSAAPSSAMLSAWRNELSRLKRADVAIPDSMVELIESDFVRTRQTTPSFSQDDLSLRMSAARLLAISYGKTELDADSWQRARDLDERRRARLTASQK